MVLSRKSRMFGCTESEASFWMMVSSHLSWKEADDVKGPYRSTIVSITLSTAAIAGSRLRESSSSSCTCTASISSSRNDSTEVAAGLDNNSKGEGAPKKVLDPMSWDKLVPSRYWDESQRICTGF